jgi:mono/diheme cytochrome c family protein
MKKVFLAAALTLVSVGASAGGRSPQTAPKVSTTTAPTAATPASYQEMLNRYCVNCHNQKAQIPAGAPLALDKANLKDPGADAAVWEKVVRKIGVGAMPPQNSPTPGAAELNKFRSSLITALDNAAAKANNPGHYVIHRLNRTEYANAVRDLLGVQVDVAELLPSDGGDFGFDNIAKALNTTPLLLERYLTAALQISDIAVGDTEVAPGTKTFSISTVVTQNQHVDGLPLGTRGGKVVRYDFPADGEYVLYGRLLRTVAEGYVGVEGHDTPHQFIITLDGEQVFSAPIGGKEDHDSSSKNITISREEVDKRMTAPRMKITAGPHDIGFTFIDRPTQEQNVWQPLLRNSLEAHNPSGIPRLRTLNIEGPYNVTGISETPSRQKIFTCKPTTAAKEASCAQEILSAVARRAFRRPVIESDVEAPLAFYAQARKNGGDFNAGIRAGLARILASPSFIFRTERSPANLASGAAHRITDLELASRMSFFLWSSIPDDELLNLAIAGRLREPKVLEAQVKRMVADDRADSLMNEFTGQWLQLRNLDKITPDILMFPDFDDNVRNAFRRETELFFASIVRENRSTLDLLDADYTFLNERLARHYGIRGVYGDRFRRVQLADQNRRGLLGQASFLALTSVANRTSPIIRGKYVISNFLNTPPLPPPPNVPELEASAPKDRPSTVREQLELHRSNPVCASCHRSIDPIGFALENFNAVGQWENATREGLKIDSAGVLVDGTPVDGPVALRKALLARPEVFVSTVTEKLMIYALGRGLDPIDMPVVRNVLRGAAKDNYRLQAIILGIVQSPAFQMRTKINEPNAVKSAAQTQTDERLRMPAR